jgi:hypothetical protein
MLEKIMELTRDGFVITIRSETNGYGHLTIGLTDLDGESPKARAYYVIEQSIINVDTVVNTFNVLRKELRPEEHV